MGAYVGDLSAGYAKAFGYTGGGTGAFLDDVEPGTPAAKAGLKRGDIILALNGAPVNSSGDLTARIASTAPGTTVQLKVFRDGKTFNVPVTLGTLPEQSGTSSQSSENGNSSGSFQPGKALAGVRVESVTPDIAQQLNMPASTKGVVVDNVDQGSAAAMSGLRRGDVILEVNHKPVSNVSEYRSAISGTGDQPVLLLVRPVNQPNNNSNITQYILIEPNQ